VRDRLIAVLGVSDGEAVPLKDRLDQPALCRVVIDDEDRFGDRPASPWTRAPVVAN
jgi:hypothetical protein